MPGSSNSKLTPEKPEKKKGRKKEEKKEDPDPEGEIDPAEWVIF